MYSKEEREKAVDLYIRYDLHASAVTRELGYPDRKSLCSWYEDRLEEEKTGIPFEPKLTKYSQVQKMDAVDYYLGHGKSLKGTIRKMGYPSHEILVSWIDELAPGTRKIRKTGIALPYRKQAEIVGDLCERKGTAQTVADEHEVSRSHLYVLKRRMLHTQKEGPEMKDPTPKEAKDVAALAGEIGELELKKHRLELNVAILEGTQALLKKAVGIAPDMLPIGKKIILVDALRKGFPLQEILSALALCRSTYYYQRKAKARDKYAKLRIRIRAISTSNYGCYGYRRITCHPCQRGCPGIRESRKADHGRGTYSQAGETETTIQLVHGRDIPRSGEPHQEGLPCWQAQREVADRYYGILHPCRQGVSFTNHRLFRWSW
jgi:transposase-like protein